MKQKGEVNIKMMLSLGADCRTNWIYSIIYPTVRSIGAQRNNLSKIALIFPMELDRSLPCHNKLL